jgi:mono/diheme cytochrome c family protein
VVGGNLPGRESDAWATGQALVALHQAGGLAISDPTYQRGLEFLLRTQFDDGSWWVRSRTWPFQPHFDSQFPHGKDQWISAAGTAWATMALLLTIEPASAKEALPTAQQLIASAASKASLLVNRVADHRPVSASAAVDFNRDIRPIFEKSCLNCHSGEKPKGSFDLSTPHGAMKGGQSGEPAIISGQAERSPLLRFVQDQVEDLEMPPLSKRLNYPALTKAQVETLRGWIDQGAPWAEGTVLKAREK